MMAASFAPSPLMSASIDALPSAIASPASEMTPDGLVTSDMPTSAFALPTAVPPHFHPDSPYYFHVRIVAVAAHSMHTLCLSEGGEVFSFGHGEKGKLGHGYEVSHWRPRRIESLVRDGVVATEISCGQQHNLVRGRPVVWY